ncbi:MAG: cell division protein FtsA [Caldilineaceae bacterium]
MKEFISAIDIGTTKICVLMAAVTHDSLGNLALQIIGEGQTPSRGIRRGVVVNVPEVTAAIREAVERCEEQAGQQVLSAYVGIAGSHIAAVNSRGASHIDQRAGVTNEDMQRALEAARHVSLPPHQEIIHTIARTWSVDGHNSIQNPIGMQGRKLEVDAHIVTGSDTAVNNLVNCVLPHGIDIDELVLEPLASNEAVLRPEERQMGVAVVDIGGGTTDIAIFIDDALAHTQVVDTGGNHLTNDVAVALHAPFETAEDLKLRFGTVTPGRVAEDEMVWASVFGEKTERSFSRHFVAEVLEARAVEIFEIIGERIYDSGYYRRIPAGFVLTGGASQLPGLVELGREVLELPVRLGKPSATQLPVVGLGRVLESPSYATSVGLLIWGLHEDGRAVHRRFAAAPDGEQGDWMRQAVGWLRNLLPG